MTPANFHKTSKSIVSWYLKNARDLPWRHTTDPYLIWISEIVLQQTTVNQGLDYYKRFIQAFPNIKSLAKAKEDKVLKLWQGLGYYSRAKNLHFTAQHIVNNFGGIFPETHEEILKLKGVGPYTAAAISSFAYNLKHAVVDGNVIRVISRIYGITDPVDQTKTKKEIEKIAASLIEKQEPNVYNQAIMEFGALNCTYKNPSCDSCPVSKKCVAFTEKQVASIPFKKNKIKKRHRFFKYLFIVDADNNTLISKRSKKDIWQGLYEFPLQEFDALTTKNPDLSFLNINNNDCQILVSKLFKQTLSHQWINAQFYKISYSKKLKNPDSTRYHLVKQTKLKQYAWPKVIDLYFNDLSITLF